MSKIDKTGEYNKHLPVTGVLTTQALLEIAHEYAPAINKMIRDKGMIDDRPDILQDIRMEILQVDCEQHIEYPKTYVLTIAFRVILKRFNKKRDQLSMRESFSEEGYQDCFDQLVDISAIRAEMRREESLYVKRIMNVAETHLSDLQLAIIQGYFLEEKSYKQLAQELNKTQDHLRQEKLRALKKLRLLVPSND